MNKLEGFWELKTLILPSIPWKRYTETEVLDADKLWTVRVAVLKGNDFNLPRKVGVSAAEAVDFAKGLLAKLNPNDLIIYYPYFVAIKSGTLEVGFTRTIIEGVDKDLWNLLTHNRRDITVIKESGKTNFYGNESFLSSPEIAELFEVADYIRRKYRRSYLTEGSLLLEWSYACECDLGGNPQGQPGLIFIEMKSVKR